MTLSGRAQPQPRWFESTGGRTGRFEAVATSGGRSVEVIGTRLAREGLAFVSRVALPEPELSLAFTIRRRSIPSRVRVMRHEPFRDAARPVHRYFCAFTALDAADLDAVGRYVDGVADPADAALAGGAPGTVSALAQARIAEQLVALKRLLPAAPGLAPLIRFEAEPTQSHDGRVARCFAVHSRLRSVDGVRSFVTRFRILARDRVELIP